MPPIPPGAALFVVGGKRGFGEEIGSVGGAVDKEEKLDD